MKQFYLVIASCTLSLAIHVPAKSQVFVFSTINNPPGCTYTYQIDMSVRIDSVKVTNIYFDNGVTGSFAFEAYVSYQNTFTNSTLPPGNFFSYDITAYSGNPNLTPQTLSNNVSNAPLQTSGAGGLASQNNPTYNASAQLLGLSINGVYSSPALLAQLGYDSVALHINLPCLDTVVTDGDGSTLPVRWSALKGEVKDGRLLLGWQTLMEQNNAGFSVESSPDGTSWQRLAWLSSKAPGGNSDHPIAYQYQHPAPFTSRSYVRVVQHDLDGRQVASNVVVLLPGNDRQNGPLLVYPNPARQFIAVQKIPMGSKYQVVDGQGRLVLQGNYQGRINVSVLRAGNYWLRVERRNTPFTIMGNR